MPLTIIGHDSGQNVTIRNPWTFLFLKGESKSDLLQDIGTML